MLLWRGGDGHCLWRWRAPALQRGRRRIVDWPFRMRECLPKVTTNHLPMPLSVAHGNQVSRLRLPQMFKTVSCTFLQTCPLSTVSFHRYSLSLWKTPHISIGGRVLPSTQQSHTPNMQRSDSNLQITLLEAARQLPAHLFLPVSPWALSALSD